MIVERTECQVLFVWWVNRAEIKLAEESFRGLFVVES